MWCKAVITSKFSNFNTVWRVISDLGAADFFDPILLLAEVIGLSRHITNITLGGSYALRGGPGGPKWVKKSPKPPDFERSKNPAPELFWASSMIDLPINYKR